MLYVFIIDRFALFDRRHRVEFSGLMALALDVEDCRFPKKFLSVLFLRIPGENYCRGGKVASLFLLVSLVMFSGARAVDSVAVLRGIKLHNFIFLRAQELSFILLVP